jgi:hypothetical protein
VSEINLFQWGKFTSHAGLELNWKIECDAISKEEWKCLARIIREKETKNWCRAEGIPRGGIPLAQELDKFSTRSNSDPVLICDDIWTTGTSFNDYIQEHYPNWLQAQGIKWVIFSRGMTHDGVKSLFSMR